MARALTIFSISRLVSASPLGQFVNLATCNCLSKGKKAPGNGYDLRSAACETPMSSDQSFFVDSDASVKTADGVHLVISVLSQDVGGWGREVRVGEVLDQWWMGPLGVDDTPETAQQLHILYQHYGALASVMQELTTGNYSAIPTVHNETKEYQFVFVCETCTTSAVPCQSETTLV